jgi:hypothetical protein
MAPLSSELQFRFRFAPAYRAAALAFGITPTNSWAVIDADRLAVRFGPWRLRTPLTNIAEVAVTGPYGFLKTAGPARLAISDRGLTFASNGERGVRLRFRRPVPGIEPSGLLRHPELTLTLEDDEGFASRVRERLS